MGTPTAREDIDNVADAYAIRGAIDYHAVTAAAYTGTRGTHPVGRGIVLADPTRRRPEYRDDAALAELIEQHTTTTPGPALTAAVGCAMLSVSAGVPAAVWWAGRGLGWW